MTVSDRQTPATIPGMALNARSVFVLKEQATLPLRWESGLLLDAAGRVVIVGRS